MSNTAPAIDDMATGPAQKISRNEFIALLAMMFATIAFSVDAMLPALGDIAGELTPDAVNKAQLVVGVFIMGMGFGTFFTGPLSDAWGRKPVVLAGLVLYTIGAACAAIAPNLETLLFARLLQGFGAAAPRVVGLSIIRDLYKGREMAKISSFVMMIFTLFPAFAPSVGASLMVFGSWRVIFVAFIGFAGLISIWFSLRLVETLPQERRITFKISTIVDGVKQVLSNRMVVVCIAVMATSFAILLSFINSIQQIYDVVFDRLDSFHYWFAFVALVGVTSNAVNAYLVNRIGMRAIISGTLGIQSILSGLVIIALFAGLDEPGHETLFFVVFIIWQISVFYMLGLLIGNLNALALEPMGHIAGMAASITGALSTVLAMIIAIPVGLLFNGTLWPLVIAIFLIALAAFGLSTCIPDREKT